MTATERRSEQRSDFPRSSRPVVAHGGRTFAVLDMCKTGLSFAVPPRSPFVVGENFSGMLSFHGGVRKPIVGRIVRVNQKCVALRLSLGAELIPADTKGTR